MKRDECVNLMGDRAIKRMTKEFSSHQIIGTMDSTLSPIYYFGRIEIPLMQLHLSSNRRKFAPSQINPFI
jgi:hypothetical protein